MFQFDKFQLFKDFQIFLLVLGSLTKSFEDIVKRVISQDIINNLHRFESDWGNVLKWLTGKIRHGLVAKTHYKIQLIFFSLEKLLSNIKHISGVFKDVDFLWPCSQFWKKFIWKIYLWENKLLSCAKLQ